VGKVRGFQTVIERMKVAVASRSCSSSGEAQLTEFDDQMMHMLAGARRTRARLVEELELARKCGDTDRQLVCTYYITEADGLISLIRHVVPATPARIPAEIS
jgi:hypothetical protein